MSPSLQPILVSDDEGEMPSPHKDCGPQAIDTSQRRPSSTISCINRSVQSLRIAPPELSSVPMPSDAHKRPANFSDRSRLAAASLSLPAQTIQESLLSPSRLMNRAGSASDRRLPIHSPFLHRNIPAKSSRVQRLEQRTTKSGLDIANTHTQGSRDYECNISDLYSGRFQASRERAEPIEIEDDETPTRPDVLMPWDSLPKPITPTSGLSMVSELKDYLSEDAFKAWLKQQAAEEKCRSKSRSLSEHPKTILDKYIHNGIPLNTRVNVELMDGDFLRILQISQDPATGEVVLSGWLFRRMMYMNGTIEKKVNEVCWILHINNSDNRTPEAQGIHLVKVEQVVKRRSLKLTNRSFPELSFREETSSMERPDIIRNNRVLVCRWRYVCLYANDMAQKRNIHSEKSLTRLRKADCDRIYGCDDNDLRQQWRGETVIGGVSSSMSTLEWAHDEEERCKAQSAIKQTRPTCEKPQTRLQPQGHPVPIPTIDLTVDDERNSGHKKTWLGSKIGRRNVVPGADWPLEHSSRSLPRMANLEGFLENIPPAGTRIRTESRVVNRHNSSAEDHFNIRLSKRQFTGSMSDKKGQQTPKIHLASQIRSVETESVPLNPYPIPSSPTDSDSTFGKERSRSPSMFICDERLNEFRPATDEKCISALDMLESRKASLAKQGDKITTKLQRYTFGDGFCGCGGVSRGAKQAGLCLKWAFDFADNMCRSYKANFPSTSVENVSAFEFTAMERDGTKVDILHLSPPCQFFSPAHTTVGQNDDRNTASSFCISLLLQQARPRIVTLENTLGLEQRHPLYLNAVIQQFTALGFSVRWKTIDLRDFGVPQSRRRLIMLASCPGEVLPEFPRPTHSKEPGSSGLKPWTTINDSIKAIPPSWPNHDVENAKSLLHAPYNGDAQAMCITTGGGDKNYHPSGKRSYTVREFACLQTFPLEHVFAQATKTSLKTQVGNSVPPVFSRCLMETLVKALRKSDGLPEEVPVVDVQADIGRNPKSNPGRKRKFAIIELE